MPLPGAASAGVSSGLTRQRAAQQAWSQRNPDYWRGYRKAQPDYAQRNREQQRSRDQARNDDLAKMDVSREDVIDASAISP